MTSHLTFSFLVFLQIAIAFFLGWVIGFNMAQPMRKTEKDFQHEVSVMKKHARRKKK